MPGRKPLNFAVQAAKRLAAKQKALRAKLRGSIEMKSSIKYKLRDLVRKALHFARKDQSLAVQASMLCAPSKKAGGQGFWLAREAQSLAREAQSLAGTVRRGADRAKSFAAALIGLTNADQRLARRARRLAHRAQRFAHRARSLVRALRELATRRQSAARRRPLATKAC
jgi:methyl-accepting chemotaxis protein